MKKSREKINRKLKTNTKTDLEEESPVIKFKPIVDQVYDKNEHYLDLKLHSRGLTAAKLAHEDREQSLSIFKTFANFNTPYTNVNTRKGKHDI